MFELFQNYPNPFNPSTTIKFNLLKSGNTKLSVFDASGREVANLIDGNMSAGVHEISYRPENLTSGVYFYRLTTKDFSDTKRMLLIK